MPGEIDEGSFVNRRGGASPEMVKPPLWLRLAKE